MNPNIQNHSPAICLWLAHITVEFFKHISLIQTVFIYKINNFSMDFVYEKKFTWVVTAFYESKRCKIGMQSRHSPSFFTTYLHNLSLTSISCKFFFLTAFAVVVLAVCYKNKTLCRKAENTLINYYNSHKLPHPFSVNLFYSTFILKMRTYLNVLTWIIIMCNANIKAYRHTFL